MQSSRRFLQVHNASLAPDAVESAAVDGSATFNPTTPFDSSMALTILVLLTALFFMGFFSVYIRRFSAADDSPSSPPASASRSQKCGLDPAAVNSLPLAAYGKAVRRKFPAIDDCPICLGEFRDGETVKAIPYCGHVFHPRCLDTWLSSHVTCPLCRSAQLFKSVEEVCLGVTPGKGESGTPEGEGRSTADDKNTCGVESSGSLRRAWSSAELADRTVLQRSTSF